MNDFVKFPIIVIGTAPRCGSTPYTHLLEQKIKFKSFHEPWSKRIIESSNDYNEVLFAKNPSMQKQKFVEYMKHRSVSNKYILKFFFADFEHRSPYQEDLSKGYKIGLFRKNIINQVVSYYVAEGRKKFHDLVDERQKNYTINIDRQCISAIVYRITNANFFLENCQFLDKKIYYEDIDFSELKSSYQKTLQPLNIEELKSTIQEVMNEKIPCHWSSGFGAYINTNNMKITYV